MKTNILLVALFVATSLGSKAQTNTIPKYTGASTFASSAIAQGSGNNLIGIGTTSPRATLDIVRQCATGNLAGILMEQNVLAPACSGGQSMGADYLIVRQFNSFTGVYQHYFYINGTGKVAIGNNAATTQLDVQALSSNDPFQLKNNAGTTVLKVLASGNTGIGTATPAARLEIRNNSTSVIPFAVYNNAGTNILTFNDNSALGINNTSPQAYLDIKSNGIYNDLRTVDASNNPHFIVQSTGNVGIGVANPTGVGSTLGIKAQGTTATILDVNATSATPNWNTQIRFLSNTGVVRHVITEDQGNMLIDPGLGGGATDKLKVAGDEAITGKLTVGSTASITGTEIVAIDGKVRIGNVTIPTPSIVSDYMLYVEKGILTEHYKCALKTTADWSDYVFNKDYKLMQVEELEQFVNKNHHLPNIPSSEEVVKNGIDLAKMDALLLEKIEELTLYIVKQQKEINALKGRKEK